MILEKASMQTINHGASPTSTTNYSILIKKNKSFLWSIDSIVSVNGNKISFNISKVENINSASPKYTPITSYSKNDVGTYHLTFASTKRRGEGRNGAAQHLTVETEDYSGGVIIHYKVKGKLKKMKIESFVKDETINAP
ncbi:MAG: hypothetical protein JNL69_10655 [Bacteroidia bacterium]|nr:hypothetical protein [Bacteroidia bacterium]